MSLSFLSDMTRPARRAETPFEDHVAEKGGREKLRHGEMELLRQRPGQDEGAGGVQMERLLVHGPASERRRACEQELDGAMPG